MCWSQHSGWHWRRQRPGTSEPSRLEVHTEQVVLPGVSVTIHRFAQELQGRDLKRDLEPQVEDQGRTPRFPQLPQVHRVLGGYRRPLSGSRDLNGGVPRP